MTTTQVAPRTSGTATRTEPAVHVRGLVKRYGGRAVVDGLDLDVQRGEVFALLGPNGAGKTTTIEILEGVRTRDDGDVRVLGADPARAGRALAGTHRRGQPERGARRRSSACARSSTTSPTTTRRLGRPTS